MKYHIVFKFLAVLLCALTLLGAILSIAGVLYLESADLYEGDLEAALQEQKQEVLLNIASDIAARYASDYLGGCDLSVIQGYYGVRYRFASYIKDEHIAWDILDETGKVLYKSTRSGTDWTAIDVAVTWGSYLRMLAPGTPTDITATAPTNPNMVSPGESDSDTYFFPDPESGIYVEYDLVHEDMPAWTVVLYLRSDAWRDGQLYEGLLLLWQNRYNLFWILGICLLLFAIGAVYLCCAAGHRPGSDEVYPGGFNLLPLDLYAMLAFFLVAACCAVCWEIHSWSNISVFTTLLCYLFIAFACCLVFVAFCFACAAQFKIPGFFWLKHTALGFCCILLWRCVKTILANLGKIPGWIKKRILGVFGFVKRVIGWFFEKLHRIYRLLPMTWQWLLTGFFLVLMLYICLRSYRTGWILIGFGVFFAFILYGAGAFGALLEATRRMSRGDLDAKVSDRLLIGAYRDFAGDLNALADAAKEAARNEMRSQRMKTELITNVSHDIKTPLTSIINYVDLLQKPHTPEEEAQYLEVLGRKSEQLKKLIQDLMEMSKASTGNISVTLGRVDAAETVTQALGEFSDKLAEKRLTTVFLPPEYPITMIADGRLAWRVLNNLLSNAVKYAMPGTRLYADLSEAGGRVRISLKNVSAEPLNISADELMERFVRGDAARNSDGSGLGLNIAKSLMEVQNGTLEVTVDGDLFKATLSFPAG